MRRIGSALGSSLATLAAPSYHFYEFVERAAIIEFDGGLPRSQAELLAAQERESDKLAKDI